MGLAGLRIRGSPRYWRLLRSSCQQQALKGVVGGLAERCPMASLDLGKPPAAAVFWDDKLGNTALLETFMDDPWPGKLDELGRKKALNIEWMEEILHQLIAGLSHYLQEFNHPRWCRISAISGISPAYLQHSPWLLRAEALQGQALLGTKFFHLLIR